MVEKTGCTIFKGLRGDWKSSSEKHFEEEGVFRSTTYNIINNYLRRGNVDHKNGGGRPVNVMTLYKKSTITAGSESQNWAITEKFGG